MSTTPEETPDIDEIGIAITLFPEDAPEKQLRSLAFGVSPFILLEADEVDGKVEFQYTGSCVDDVEALLEMLESFTGLLQTALEQNPEVEIPATPAPAEDIDDE